MTRSVGVRRLPSLGGAEVLRSEVVDVQQLAEYRYRTVREVLGGSPIGEVAARYGTSRQTLHTWRRRFVLEGMPGLLDRSRRAEQPRGPVCRDGGRDLRAAPPASAVGCPPDRP